MIAILDALKWAREMNPAFKTLASDGKGVTFRTELEEGAKGADPYPLVEIAFALRKATQTNAGVPFEIVETVKVARASDLHTLVDALIANAGAGIFHPDGLACVRDMNALSTTFEQDLGGVRRAVITWGVEASWRPAV